MSLGGRRRGPFRWERVMDLALRIRPWVGLRRLRRDHSSDVIVSLTSFPARLHGLHLAVESLLRQEAAVARLVLVLCEEEFPDRRLPWILRRQMRRGMEVLWVARNGRSYDKLIPVRSAHPQAVIVTFDDDKHYRPDALPALLAAAEQHPGAIIGHRGRRLAARHTGWSLTSAPADCSTPPEQVVLTGNAGVLYPPGLIDDALLTDIGLAQEVCPTNDDLWFWAVAAAAAAPRVCLGSTKPRKIRQLAESPSLADVNGSEGRNQAQLEEAARYLRIRPGASPTSARPD
jgi:hypothetical protein